MEKIGDIENYTIENTRINKLHILSMEFHKKILMDKILELRKENRITEGELSELNLKMMAPFIDYLDELLPHDIANDYRVRLNSK